MTRRDLERLFGVSRARAAQLRGGARRIVARPAAERSSCGSSRSYRARAAYRHEEQRRARLVTELRQARLTGIRVAVPVEALEARLAGLPEGVTVEPGRIEVRFAGAKEAVVKLFALAQALTGDYERFEDLVGKGETVGMSEALVPAPSAGRVEIERPGAAAVALPAVIVDAGPAAVERFLEFFAAAIANGRTRAAYGRAAGQFLAPGAARGASRCGRSRRSTSPPTSGRTRDRCPTVKQHLAAIRASGRNPWRCCSANHWHATARSGPGRSSTTLPCGERKPALSSRRLVGSVSERGQLCRAPEPHGRRVMVPRHPAAVEIEYS